MNLELTSAERNELMRLVEDYFSETRVEVRHTQNREYRIELLREEELLRGLLEKLKKLQDTDIEAQAI